MAFVNGISKCGRDSLVLSSFLTTQIEMKKLKLHVPDAMGKSKCQKMHIGRKHDKCPTLKVHETVMEEVNEIT